MSEESSCSGSHLEDGSAAVVSRNPQEAENSASAVVQEVAEKVPRMIIRFGSRIVRIFPGTEVGEPSSSKANAVDEEPPRKRMKLPPKPKHRRVLSPSHYDEGLAKLRGLGVENPTWILGKSLSESDVSGGQSRLLLPGMKVMQTPLLEMMRTGETELANDKTQGLPVTVLDESGREFEMVFKYLNCNGSYRLIGQWGMFVGRNRMRAGDEIQMWAFRRRRRSTIDEEVDALGLALLKGLTVDEWDAAEGLLLLNTPA